MAAVLTTATLLALPSEAAVSKTINYEGRLTDNSDVSVADGPYDFVFKIYTVAGGGSAAWTESWTAAALWTSAGGNTISDGTGSNGCPTGTKKIIYGTTTNESSLAAGQQVWDTTLKESAVVQSVTTASHYLCAYNPLSTWAGGDTLTNRLYVKGGIFSASLGTITPQTVDFSSGDYYLGVAVGADSEMVPRKKLTSVPQAINANNLVGDGHIDVDNTSTAQDAASINYNPASGANNALSVIYGGGGGTGKALSVTQSGTGYAATFMGGNVGIGTTSPGAKLQVNVDTTGQAFRGVLTNNGSGNNYIDFALGNTSSIAGDFTGEVGNMFVTGNNYSAGSNLYIPNTYNFQYWGSSFMNFVARGGGSINFAVSNGGPSLSNVALQINSSGNVGIGTTNPGSYNLQVNGTGGFSTSANSPIFQGQAAAVTFGNASYNTALTSNVWGITAPGVASGLTAITSSGNITLSGLTANRFVTSGTGGLLELPALSPILSLPSVMSPAPPERPTSCSPAVRLSPEA